MAPPKVHPGKPSLYQNPKEAPSLAEMLAEYPMAKTAGKLGQRALEAMAKTGFSNTGNTLLTTIVFASPGAAGMGLGNLFSKAGKSLAKTGLSKVATKAGNYAVKTSRGISHSEEIKAALLPLSYLVGKAAKGISAAAAAGQSIQVFCQATGLPSCPQ